MRRYLLILPIIAFVAISWTTRGGKNAVSARSKHVPAAFAAAAEDPSDTTLIFSDFISPNGDGINDHFVIVNVMYYPGNSIDIFNRWGEKVYHSDPYLNEWDGVNNRGNAAIDERVTDGVYFYEFHDGLGNDVTGKITVKR
jgi:gliding motility-associated-like protein